MFMDEDLRYHFAEARKMIALGKMCSRLGVDRQNIMSRYELLHEELNRIRARQFLSSLIPALIIGILVGSVVRNTCAISISITISVITILVGVILSHHLWRIMSVWYANLCDRAKIITCEIHSIQKQVDSIFSKYRERMKGERFKKAYHLSGKTLYELEEALSVGMYREQCEIFVTAFMRKGVTVRITASIGSRYRCSPADKLGNWEYHSERLGCDQIRQYHNHSVHNGKTQPSQMDYKTSKVLESVLNGIEFRSFIIYWNAIREWKVIEYSGDGKSWLYFEYDAAAQRAV
jgi:hypothetical protein